MSYNNLNAILRKVKDQKQKVKKGARNSGSCFRFLFRPGRDYFLLTHTVNN